jgi:hypothetical protein
MQEAYSFFTVQFEVAYFNYSDASSLCRGAFEQSVQSMLDGVDVAEVVSETNHDYSQLPMMLRPPYVSTDVRTKIYFFNSYIGDGYYSKYNYYLHILEHAIYHSDNFTELVEQYAGVSACIPLQNISVVSSSIITAATIISKSVQPTYSPTASPTSSPSSVPTSSPTKIDGVAANLLDVPLDNRIGAGIACRLSQR